MTSAGSRVTHWIRPQQQPHPQQQPPGPFTFGWHSTERGDVLLYLRNSLLLSVLRLACSSNWGPASHPLAAMPVRYLLCVQHAEPRRATSLQQVLLTSSLCPCANRRDTEEMGNMIQRKGPQQCTDQSIPNLVSRQGKPRPREGWPLALVHIAPEAEIGSDSLTMMEWPRTLGS